MFIAVLRSRGAYNGRYNGRVFRHVYSSDTLIVRAPEERYVYSSDTVC